MKTRLLSDLDKCEVLVGMKVFSLATGNTGVVADICNNVNYKEDDVEKNPVVTINWKNGNVSIQPLIFLDKIRLL